MTFVPPVWPRAGVCVENRGIKQKEFDLSTEKKLICQPADWWHAFRAAAEKDGVSLSEWLGESGKNKLPAYKVRKLSKRPSRGRPANETTNNKG